MSLHTVASQAVPPTPWRNGGGQTRELLAWPQADDWALRVSVADIDQDGPFSAFAGVQRWFAVLEGEGVGLDFGHRFERVQRAQPPVVFDGQDAPDCGLIDGPTRDLNFMLQTAQGRGRMVDVASEARWPAGPLWRALYTQSDQVLLCGATPVAVAAGSLLWSANDGHDWAVAQPVQAGQAWWLCFTPVAERAVP